MLASTAKCAAESQNLSAQSAVESDIDLHAFTRDIDSLRRKTVSSLSLEDFKHMLKIQMFGRIATFLGLATAWIIPNPITAALFCFGNYTRFTIAHHILHKGYDKIPGIPSRYTSKVFARGWRRYLDWLDWMEPRSWKHVHNNLHHFYTGETEDPDLVERHVQYIRNSKLSKAGKYILTAIGFMTWKFSFYAPTSMSTIDLDNDRRLGPKHFKYLGFRDILNLSNPHVRNVWLHCYAPYGLFHFVLLPSLFLPFSSTAALFVLINKLLAEVFINVHSFIVIGSNHTGEDIPHFAFHFKDKSQYYLTQVIGSSNYRYGGDLYDVSHIWLNYQIEHHLMPDLPMLKYRQIQPEVKKICEKHGVPYLEEGLVSRLKKLIDICVANADTPVIKDVSVLGKGGCYSESRPSSQAT